MVGAERAGPRAERWEAGRARRAEVPRGTWADWTPPRGRPEPVTVLERSAPQRVEELLPYRYERMAVSPFAFLRGSAEAMAADLVGMTTTGLEVQACGDAHIGNFGEFATPERNIVFDVNDFDETLPGAWEWDVVRLAASVEVALEANGVPSADRRPVVAATVGAYRRRMAGFASLRALELWYSRIDISDAIASFPPAYRPLVERDVARARRRTHLRALSKLTRVTDGVRHFVSDPPLLVRLEGTGHDMDEVAAAIEGYRRSLPDDRRELFDRFRLVDVARKVVGVGSVGTRCWVGLLEGPDHPAGDPLFLQVKEAGPSALSALTGAGAAEGDHHGLRVVTGQRLTQAASDIFLGWSEGPRSGRHYYVRQLWDVKGAGDPAAMDPVNLSHYAQLCAWALARAHARTGDPVAITGYLGRSDRFDRAVATFAARYAGQNRADHAALAAALGSGRLPSAGQVPATSSKARHMEA